MSRIATWQDVIEGRAQWCVVNEKNDAILASIAEAGVMVDVTLTDPPYDDHTHANVKTSKGIRRNAATPSIAVNFDPIDPRELAPKLLIVTRRWLVAFTAMEQLGQWREGGGTRMGPCWCVASRQPDTSVVRRQARTGGGGHCHPAPTRRWEVSLERRWERRVLVRTESLWCREDGAPDAETPGAYA